MTPTKKCSKCFSEKPLTDFYENRHVRSGYFARCKTCVKGHQNLWNKTEDGKCCITKYRKENREKINAYVAVYGRSEKGKISRRKYRKTKKAKEARKRYVEQKYRGEADFHKNFRKMMDARKSPEKVTAWKKANNAVRSGKLVRTPCPCGDPKSHAHHEDYSKPLDVVFLCASCHMKRHYELQLLDLDTY